MGETRLELVLDVCTYETLKSRLLAQCDGWLSSRVEYVEPDTSGSLWKLCLVCVMCILCILPGAFHTWEAVMNRSALSAPLI